MALPWEYWGSFQVFSVLKIISLGFRIHPKINTVYHAHSRTTAFCGSHYDLTEYSTGHAVFEVNLINYLCDKKDDLLHKFFNNGIEFKHDSFAAASFIRGMFTLYGKRDPFHQTVDDLEEEDVLQPSGTINL